MKKKKQRHVALFLEKRPPFRKFGFPYRGEFPSV